MIGWYTDNEISQKVMSAVEKRGHSVKHIYQFTKASPSVGEHVFYGILRGTGRCMHISRHRGDNYWYIDNGYFDAEYIDKQGFKSMDGKYRIVKNDMIERYDGPEIEGDYAHGKTFLIIPPSTYTANFYDTTPEDWINKWRSMLIEKGYQVEVRSKEAGVTFSIHLDWVKRHDGAVLAFNSMALVAAVERGIPVYDTHGLFRNADEIKYCNFVPRVNHAFDDVRDFYEPKSFTLQEITEGKSCL